MTYEDSFYHVELLCHCLPCCSSRCRRGMHRIPRQGARRGPLGTGEVPRRYAGGRCSSPVLDDTPFWEELEPYIRTIGEDVPLVCVGYDPSHWSLSTVSPDIVTTCYSYLTYNGADNLRNLFRFIERELGGTGQDVAPPQEVPWQGIYHRMPRDHSPLLNSTSTGIP